LVDTLSAVSKPLASTLPSPLATVTATPRGTSTSWREAQLVTRPRHVTRSLRVWPSSIDQVVRVLPPTAQASNHRVTFTSFTSAGFTTTFESPASMVSCLPSAGRPSSTITSPGANSLCVKRSARALSTVWSSKPRSSGSSPSSAGITRTSAPVWMNSTRPSPTVYVSRLLTR
jgi:hypothetical protein